MKRPNTNTMPLPKPKGKTAKPAVKKNYYEMAANTPNRKNQAAMNRDKNTNPKPKYGGK